LYPPLGIVDEGVPAPPGNRANGRYRNPGESRKRAFWGKRAVLIPAPVTPNCLLHTVNSGCVGAHFQPGGGKRKQHPGSHAGNPGLAPGNTDRQMTTGTYRSVWFELIVTAAITLALLPVIAALNRKIKE